MMRTHSASKERLRSFAGPRARYRSPIGRFAGAMHRAESPGRTMVMSFLSLALFLLLRVWPAWGIIRRDRHIPGPRSTITTEARIGISGM